jgi:hypothetical protein
MSSWWHGGPRIEGDWVLSPYLTQHCRSGDHDFDRVVFITPERELAINYAVTCAGWLYEVDPMLPIVQDPGSILAPGVSMMCESAHILRRFRPSRRDIQRRQFLIDALS